MRSKSNRCEVNKNGAPQIAAGICQWAGLAFLFIFTKRYLPPLAALCSCQVAEFGDRWLLVRSSASANRAKWQTAIGRLHSSARLVFLKVIQAHRGQIPKEHSVLRTELQWQYVQAQAIVPVSSRHTHTHTSLHILVPIFLLSFPSHLYKCRLWVQLLVCMRIWCQQLRPSP